MDPHTHYLDEGKHTTSFPFVGHAEIGLLDFNVGWTGLAELFSLWGVLKVLPHAYQLGWDVKVAILLGSNLRKAKENTLRVDRFEQLAIQDEWYLYEGEAAISLYKSNFRLTLLSKDTAFSNICPYFTKLVIWLLIFFYISLFNLPEIEAYTNNITCIGFISILPWSHAVWAAGCSQPEWGGFHQGTSSWTWWYFVRSCGRSLEEAVITGSHPDAWTPVEDFFHGLVTKK